MAKTTQEKIELKMAEKEQLENELKRLMQQHKAEERKARTNRLCKRHGLFESLLPDTIPLIDERFKAFLTRMVCTGEAKAILKDLTDEQELEAEIAAEETAKAAAGSKSAENDGSVTAAAPQTAKPVPPITSPASLQSAQFASAKTPQNAGGNPANPAQSDGKTQAARPAEAQKASV
jgi:hypothetical protein